MKLNISNWIEFDINKKDIRTAEALAKKRRDTCRRLGLKVIFQSNELENELIGLLGEDIFESHLKSLGIHYERGRSLEGPDKFDFMISDKIYSIKTNNSKIHPSRSSDRYKFFINKLQYDKYTNPAYYVSMMIYNLEKAWICGLISRAEVPKYPLTDPSHASCYNIPFSALHIPHDLSPLLSYRQTRLC